MHGAGDLMNSHFQRLLGPNNFSIGLELPLGLAATTTVVDPQGCQ